MKRAIIILLLIIPSCETAYAQQVPPELWKGIEGEAVGEGYNGMVAVAFVYRNRIQHNMKLGCCALHRKDLNQFIAKQGAKYAKMAKEISQKVFTGDLKDPTNGATHYENVERYGYPRWSKGMIITAKIGSHTFFRKI